jgi:protoporphyrinogen IX oxidase
MDYIKALHIIFVVTWFAGLFYIVRLFVYHAEASLKSEPEKSILVQQFKIMQLRLWYGITWPSLIGTYVFGWLMVYQIPEFLIAPWFHVKLSLVLLLTIYHLICGNMFKKFQEDENKKSSDFFRVWNEVATLFLVSVVFIVELQHSINWLYGLLGLVVFSLILMIAIRIYKSMRNS